MAGFDVYGGEDHLTNYDGLAGSVCRYCEQVPCSATGLGSTTTSALGRKKIHLLGFLNGASGGHGGNGRHPWAKAFKEQRVDCFPDGNAHVAAYFLEGLLLSAVSNTTAAGEIIRGEVRFGEVDKRTDGLDGRGPQRPERAKNLEF